MAAAKEGSDRTERKLSRPTKTVVSCESTSPSPLVRDLKKLWPREIRIGTQ